MSAKNCDKSASRKSLRAALGRVVWGSLGITPFLAVPLIWSYLSSLPSSAAISFKSDFESGNHSEWRAGELNTPWALQFVNGIGANKTKVARFEYRSTDVIKYDTEKADLAGPRVPMGSDQWYAFEFYLPNDFTTNPRGALIFQNHSGIKGVKPATYLVIEKKKNDVDSLTFAVNYTQDGKISRDTIKLRTNLGPVIKGAWQKCLLNVKWLPNDKGRIEFYLNGKLKYSRSGIIGYNDPTGKYRGPYPRIGFYMGNDKKIVKNYTDKSVIYFDNFRMGPTRASVDFARK